jgi:hypothetical protein
MPFTPYPTPESKANKFKQHPCDACQIIAMGYFRNFPDFIKISEVLNYHERRPKRYFSKSKKQPVIEQRGNY